MAQPFPVSVLNCPSRTKWNSLDSTRLATMTDAVHMIPRKSIADQSWTMRLTRVSEVWVERLTTGPASYRLLPDRREGNDQR